MADVRIENPVLNSPFEQPTLHRALTDFAFGGTCRNSDPIVGAVTGGRRMSILALNNHACLGIWECKEVIDLLDARDSPRRSVRLMPAEVLDVSR